MTDIPDGSTWLGAPAQPDKQAKRQLIAIQHLPELLRRVNKLERKLGVSELPSTLGETGPSL
jgi:UDP-3-O-[3-hydroxymyristoyl] glucosamine N-acyltransferase